IQQTPNRIPTSLKNKDSSFEKLMVLCNEDPHLCESSSRKNTPRVRYSDRKSKEFFLAIKNAHWSQLPNFGSSFALEAFRRKKINQLQEIVPQLLSASCEASESRHALAAIIEDHLPDKEALRSSVDLYEKNATCDISKITIGSTYRAGMLRILEDRCDAAVPLLKKVLLSNEDHLKSRSLYWSWNCLGKSAQYLESMKFAVPYFSYHGLLMNHTSSHSFIEGQGLRDSTPFLYNSTDMGLNKARDLVSDALTAGEIITARSLIEKISIDRLQSAEPEYRIQWAYYMHMAQVGVRKFQVLGKLINDHPDFRTKSVKSMLFPNWYFESVSFHSSQVDPWLIQSLIRQESAFDPRARSRVGATGLMQLMPATARIYGKINRQQLKDPEQNVRVGVRFFERLLNRYDGNIHYSLAAYNAGPGKVDDWVKRYPTQDPQLFSDIIPYRETREYVAFILRNYYWYQYLNGQPKLSSPLLSQQKIELTAFE
ncbi:MAG: lytic transglycosylase domain-containing protein, partial [Bdellovibrionales bacterium]